MNEKNIKKHLNGKFKDWLESIDDEKLRDNVSKNAIITGGCIVSLLQNEKVNDYDIYFTNAHTVIEVCKYYTKKFNLLLKENDEEEIPFIIQHNDNNYVYKNGDYVTEEGDDIGTNIMPEEGVIINSDTYKEREEIDIDSDRVHIYIKSSGIAKFPEHIFENKEDINIPKYYPKYITSNAITLSDKIQLITRFYGSAVEIHKNFDFVHVTNYWESDKNKLKLKKPALQSILTKELRYVGSLYPVCSVIRTRKFINREWNINAGEYLKMLFQVSQLDLSDVEVLKEQLIGVDTLYFEMLIDRLKEMKKKNSQFKLEYDYLVRVTDKIFNN